MAHAQRQSGPALRATHLDVNRHGTGDSARITLAFTDSATRRQVIYYMSEREFAEVASQLGYARTDNR